MVRVEDIEEDDLQLRELLQELSEEEKSFKKAAEDIIDDKRVPDMVKGDVREIYRKVDIELAEESSFLDILEKVAEREDEEVEQVRELLGIPNWADNYREVIRNERERRNNIETRKAQEDEKVEEALEAFEFLHNRHEELLERFQEAKSNHNFEEMNRTLRKIQENRERLNNVLGKINEEAKKLEEVREKFVDTLDSMRELEQSLERVRKDLNQNVKKELDEAEEEENEVRQLIIQPRQETLEKFRNSDVESQNASNIEEYIYKIDQLAEGEGSLLEEEEKEANKISNATDAIEEETEQELSRERKDEENIEEEERELERALSRIEEDLKEDEEIAGSVQNYEDSTEEYLNQARNNIGRFTAKRRDIAIPFYFASILEELVEEIESHQRDTLEVLSLAKNIAEISGALKTVMTSKRLVDLFRACNDLQFNQETQEKLRKEALSFSENMDTYLDMKAGQAGEEFDRVLESTDQRTRNERSELQEISPARATIDKIESFARQSDESKAAYFVSTIVLRGVNHMFDIDTLRARMNKTTF